MKSGPPADVSVRAMAAILPLSGYSTISGVPCDAAMHVADDVARAVADLVCAFRPAREVDDLALLQLPLALG